MLQFLDPLRMQHSQYRQLHLPADHRRYTSGITDGAQIQVHKEKGKDHRKAKYMKHINPVQQICPERKFLRIPHEKPVQIINNPNNATVRKNAF